MEQDKMDAFKQGFQNRDEARDKSRGKTYQMPAEIRQKARELDEKSRQNLKSKNAWLKMS
jgi:hypothetical protein